MLLTVVMLLWLTTVAGFNSGIAFHLGFRFAAHVCAFSTLLSAALLLLAVLRVFRFVVVPRDFEARIVAKPFQEDEHAKSRGSDDRRTEG